MTGVRIELDVTGLGYTERKLGRDLQPAFESIGEYPVRTAKDRFREEMPLTAHHGSRSPNPPSSARRGTRTGSSPCTAPGCTHRIPGFAERPARGQRAHLCRHSPVRRAEGFLRQHKQGSAHPIRRHPSPGIPRNVLCGPRGNRKHRERFFAFGRVHDFLPSTLTHDCGVSRRCPGQGTISSRMGTHDVPPGFGECTAGSACQTIRNRPDSWFGPNHPDGTSDAGQG